MGIGHCQGGGHKDPPKFTNPKDHWTLKTGYFEDPTPASYRFIHPSIGGSLGSLGNVQTGQANHPVQMLCTAQLPWNHCKNLGKLSHDGSMHGTGIYI